MVYNAEHANVVEGVPVVLGEPEFASGLIIEELNGRKTDVGDHTAKVRVRIFEGPDQLDDLTVVQSEAAEVLNGLDGREPPREPVVLLAQPEHERVLLASV